MIVEVQYSVKIFSLKLYCIPLSAYHSGSSFSPPLPTHVWNPGSLAAPVEINNMHLMKLKSIPNQPAFGNGKRIDSYNFRIHKNPVEIKYAICPGNCFPNVAPSKVNYLPSGNKYPLLSAGRSYGATWEGRKK